MSIRDQAAELLKSADLFTDEDRPVATVAELATAFDVPPAAVRSAAVDVGAVKIGASLALTEERALDLAEELSSRGFQIGDESGEDDEDAEESACEDDPCECIDHDPDDPDACDDDECPCVDHDDDEE